MNEFLIRNKRLRTHDRPLQERMRDANMINVMLLYMEVVLVGELDRMAHATLRDAKETGAYRLLMKRSVNDLMACVGKLVQRCRATDCDVLLNAIVEKLPYYRKPYAEEGGGSVNFLHSYFRRVGLCELDDRLRGLCLELADQAGVENRELMADACVMMSLAQSGIESYELAMKQVDKLLGGDVRIRRMKSRHHEQVVHLAQQMLRMLTHGREDVNALDSLREQIRETKREIHRLISGARLVEVCESALDAATMDYTEFALACLLKDSLTGNDTEEPMRQIAEKLGGDPEAAKELLEELKGSDAAKQAYLWDPWDLMELLPAGKEEGALRKFRSMGMVARNS